MALLIKIKKERDKPSTLFCAREDGTSTFSKLQIDFEIHDIAHFVVERQLGLKNAFYGLLSQGYQISDFQLPKKKRPEALQPQNLPSEALATEHLVNLLTIDFKSENEMDISTLLDDILKENQLSFSKKLEREEITSIQKELATLMAKWRSLVYNETLEMVFEVQHI